MVKVITYGTYDLLHYGHIRLLERAKALGDYLIVGVTADGFDKTRGKINVKQSLMERIENVRTTGLADEIIVEEYEGQKIDDIKRLCVDVFTVGSDWKGHFDYLSEFCKVVYLERTQGISSTDLRTQQRNIRIGLVGASSIINKFESESHHVNGVEIAGLWTLDGSNLSERVKLLPVVTDNYAELLKHVDALYVASHPRFHYDHIRDALFQGKHVLCESPIAMSVAQLSELRTLAHEHGCVLMDGIKTAYATAYHRLILLAKTGCIGRILSVDATCTSLEDLTLRRQKNPSLKWNSICDWGPQAMLPIFQLLGTKYTNKETISWMADDKDNFDLFTRISFAYPNAVASLKVGKGVKSEGELVISGTKGYIYVPAPWWKTDYFEIRHENPADNKRFFYQLDGEGLRYELVTFLKAIETKRETTYVDADITEAIVGVIEEAYHSKIDLV